MIINRDDYMTREEYNKLISVLNKLDELQDELIDEIKNRSYLKYYKNDTGYDYWADNSKRHSIIDDGIDLISKNNIYPNRYLKIPIKYISKINQIEFEVTKEESELGCVYLSDNSKFRDIETYIDIFKNEIDKAMEIKENYKDRIVDVEEFDYINEYKEVYDIIKDMK